LALGFYALTLGCVYALTLGAYGYAAVLRCGLGPLPPPLCRYAVHTKRQGIECGRCATVDSDMVTRAGRRCIQRSGIKEEELALGQHGGQPRS
jgi:hypothetical protein